MARAAIALLLLCTLGFASGETIRVLTHTSFVISSDVIAEFEDQTGITVEFIEGGDAGTTVNRAILTRERPLADLLFGVDNSLIARALDARIFEPYQSSRLEHVPGEYIFDEQGFVTPVDVGFVNFNFDLAWFDERDISAPADITDLTQAPYRGLTVVPNPVTSSPGLAFMLATIDRFGTEGDYSWLHYWRDLRDNDVQLADGWSDAYYTHFNRYGGDRPVVLSYASSPAAEVYFAEEPLQQSPTANLFCEKCVYRQIEGVGILQGTENRAAAEEFIDYMLSLRFQEDIPLNMWVYPIRQDAALPEVFAFAERPQGEHIAELPSAEIEANLSDWLSEWTRVVEQGQEP